MENLPSWIVERPIAHRGLHDRTSGVPENSLAAFEAAVAAGYPIELDVQLLADGQVVVFHDFDLKRLTGDGRDVADCTAEDLRPLRLDGTDQPVPLLTEVLAAVGGRTPLLIELKSPSRDDRRLERAVGVLLADCGDPVAVQSFNSLSLKWFREHMPEIPRGQLGSDFAGTGPAAAPVAGHGKASLRDLMPGQPGRPAFVACDARRLRAWTPEQKRLVGLPLLAWTVRSFAEAARALKHADNIIFEGFRPECPPP